MSSGGTPSHYTVIPSYRSSSYSLSENGYRVAYHHPVRIPSPFIPLRSISRPADSFGYLALSQGGDVHGITPPAKLDRQWG